MARNTGDGNFDKGRPLMPLRKLEKVFLEIINELGTDRMTMEAHYGERQIVATRETVAQQMYERGCRVDQIADIMDKDRTTIRRYIRKGAGELFRWADQEAVKIKRRNYMRKHSVPEEDLKAIIRQWAETDGVQYEQIVGTGRNREVVKLRHNYIMRLYTWGIQITQIGRAMNKNGQSVQYVIDKSLQQKAPQ